MNEETCLSNQKKERQSNLELFRIITMLIIVAHHYVVNSGLVEMVEARKHFGEMIFSSCRLGGEEKQVSIVLS